MSIFTTDLSLLEKYLEDLALPRDKIAVKVVVYPGSQRHKTKDTCLCRIRKYVQCFLLVFLKRTLERSLYTIDTNEYQVEKLSG